MADASKNVLDFKGLQEYDKTIKGYIEGTSTIIEVGPDELDDNGVPITSIGKEGYIYLVYPTKSITPSIFVKGSNNLYNSSTGYVVYETTGVQDFSGDRVSISDLGLTPGDKVYVAPLTTGSNQNHFNADINIYLNGDTFTSISTRRYQSTWKSATVNDTTKTINTHIGYLNKNTNLKIDCLILDRTQTPKGYIYLEGEYKSLDQSSDQHIELPTFFNAEVGDSWYSVSIESEEGTTYTQGIYVKYTSFKDVKIVIDGIRDNYTGNYLDQIPKLGDIQELSAGSQSVVIPLVGRYGEAINDMVRATILFYDKESNTLLKSAKIDPHNTIDDLLAVNSTSEKNFWDIEIWDKGNCKYGLLLYLGQYGVKSNTEYGLNEKSPSYGYSYDVFISPSRSYFSYGSWQTKLLSEINASSTNTVIDLSEYKGKEVFLTFVLYDTDKKRYVDYRVIPIMVGSSDSSSSSSSCSWLDLEDKPFDYLNVDQDAAMACGNLSYVNMTLGAPFYNLYLDQGNGSTLSLYDPSSPFNNKYAYEFYITRQRDDGSFVNGIHVKDATISPSKSQQLYDNNEDKSSLGSADYKWDDLYVNKIHVASFDVDNSSITIGSLVLSYSSIVPRTENSTVSLGTKDKKISYIYAKNITTDNLIFDTLNPGIVPILTWIQLFDQDSYKNVKVQISYRNMPTGSKVQVQGMLKNGSGLAMSTELNNAILASSYGEPLSITGSNKGSSITVFVGNGDTAYPVTIDDIAYLNVYVTDSGDNIIAFKDWYNTPKVASTEDALAYLGLA